MGTRREQYRSPEDRTLADLMVGHRVIVQRMGGPEPDPDDPDREVRGQPQAVTGAYWLHAISQVGVELSRSLSEEEEGASEIFLVPWASVLLLDGVARSELEREARESLVIDRQALLERLRDPRPEDTDIGLDARRYLTFNPADKEVREALGRLPSPYEFS